MRTLRADLHVHSWHSRQSGNLRFLKSRDCYSPPDDVYRVAKARGMDLVTITDHDSIDGCLEFLNRHPDSPDFFISEEVSCRLPDGDVQVHLGVHGLDERLHRELQPLRRNVFDVTSRLREAGVFFVLNHLLHFYRRHVPLDAYLRLLQEVPALEVRNGTMLPSHNQLVGEIADAWKGREPFARIGGSDAHTLRRIGRTWTEAPGDSSADFLRSLRDRRSRADGAHGGTLAVAADAYGVVYRYCANLLGYGPRDHGVARRVACLAFSVATVPAQFLPLAIVARGKRREAQEVVRARRELARLLDRLPAEMQTAARTTRELETQV
jgi:predicted metal-dependent phosphoesterase TrpH